MDNNSKQRMLESTGGKANQDINDTGINELTIIDDFTNWNDVKINLDLHGRQPKISQGQLWWTGVGKNVGSELNGKNERFSRPVLVYRKLCSNKFMAIPLTSQPHEGNWYIHFIHNDKEQIAVVSEARVMSTKRLYRMIGRIDDADYERIRAGFINLYG